jgi:uncharacterized protein YndB with AHSA1/START domain
MSHSHSESSDALAVVVSMTIAAEPATVWRFLSEESHFAAWIGAFAGQSPLEGTKIDPRVGGEIHVRYPDGSAAIGRITSMEPLHRIVFTWGYSKETHGLPPGSSRVEITLTPIPDGTLVRLLHTGLPTQERRKDHLGGWKHYLSILSREAARLHHVEAAETAFTAYFRAWGEPNESSRVKLLSDSCIPDVKVRTSFACTEDMTQLSEHIAGSLRHMPGISLCADGPVQTMHGHARVRWSIRTQEGQAVGTGEIFAVLSLRGRLERIVSFSDPR